MAKPGFGDICRTALQDWKAARRRILKSGAGRGAVHQWRICTRRLLALEALLAPRTATASASLHSELHNAFHASGRLRDAQLTWHALRHWSAAIPEASRLARHEKQEIPRLAGKLCRTLRAIHAKRLARITSQWLLPPRGDAERILPARATRRLQQLQRRIAATPQDTARQLHRHRLLLKLARYMAEHARTAGLAVPAQLDPARLAKLQTELGRVTDLDVQLRAVARYARQHPDWRQTARALQTGLRGHRESALRSRRAAPRRTAGRD